MPWIRLFRPAAALLLACCLFPPEAPAAGMARGVNTLGYGRSAPSSAPPSSYGRSPRDYSRGYEGTAPGDPWNRESDFKARSYQFRHGPQPENATPPTHAPAPPESVTSVPSLVIPTLPEEGTLPRPSTGTPQQGMRQGTGPDARPDARQDAQSGVRPGAQPAFSWPKGLERQRGLGGGR